MESLRDYLEQLLTERVRESFKKIHTCWTEEMVQEEVKIEMEEIESRVLDIVKLIANGDR